jgi:hypothetical protein
LDSSKKKNTKYSIRVFSVMLRLHIFFVFSSFFISFRFNTRELVKV